MNAGGSGAGGVNMTKIHCTKLSNEYLKSKGLGHSTMPPLHLRFRVSPEEVSERIREPGGRGTGGGGGGGGKQGASSAVQKDKETTKKF